MLSTRLSTPSSAQRRARVIVVPTGKVTLAQIGATGLVGAVMYAMASAISPPALAQDAPKPPSRGCEEPAHTAATPPATGADSGTKPGGSGSTGWSGGTGGSNIGTTPQASTPGSPDRQPAVVTGVDPKPAQQGKC